MARFPAQDQNTEFGAVSALCCAGNRFVAIGFAQRMALLDVLDRNVLDRNVLDGNVLDGNDNAADSSFFSRRTFGGVY